MALCKGHSGEPFVRGGSGVLIVPLTIAQEVLFVVEPAVVDGSPVLWLPSGAVDVGEIPAESAARELQEEVGYKPQRLDLLCELHPLARHGEWVVWPFLARDLIPMRLSGDESHEIRVEPIPLSRLEGIIASGRLKDSSCIAALFLTQAFLRRNVSTGPPPQRVENCAKISDFRVTSEGLTP